MKILRSREYKYLLRARDHLSRILDSVGVALSENDRFHYQYNEPGSGEICYTGDNRRIEFNSYASEFDGFRVNGQEVAIDKVIKLLNLP